MGLAARAEGLKRIRKTMGPWEAPPRSPDRSGGWGRRPEENKTDGALEGPPLTLDPQRGLAPRPEGLKRIRKTIGPWEAHHAVAYV